MGTALRGRNQVDVALRGAGLVVEAPDERPVERLALAFEMAGEGRLRQPFAFGKTFLEVLLEALVVMPRFSGSGLFDLERDLEARAEHSLGSEHVPEPRQREGHGIEVLRIGPETDRRARIGLADLAHDVELAAACAVDETHVVFGAAALDPHLEVLRQRVDDRDAHTVQSARKAVVLVRELAAGVQLREDELDAGHLFLRMHVDRHAATVVLDFERAVAEQAHAHLLRVAFDRLVDAVVDDLVREVVRPRGVGVHAGPAAHGLEAAKHFDVGSEVALAHR